MSPWAYLSYSVVLIEDSTRERGIHLTRFEQDVDLSRVSVTVEDGDVDFFVCFVEFVTRSSQGLIQWGQGKTRTGESCYGY